MYRVEKKRTRKKQKKKKRKKKMTVSSFQSGKSFRENTHGSNFTEKTQPGFVSSPTCPCKPS